MLIASAVGRTGTLGLVVREAGGTRRLFAMTNAHVVTRPDENHVGDPVEAVLATGRETIGRVAYHSGYGTLRRNRVDLALVALNSRGATLARPYTVQTLSGRIVGSGPLSASRFGGALRSHTYSGHSSVRRDIVQCGRVSEHAAVILRDQGGTPMEFGRTFIFSALSGPVEAGHSGSILVRAGRSGLIVDGLLAGGGASGAFVFSFSDILNDLANAGIRLG